MSQPHIPTIEKLVVAALGMSSVVSLLAWVYDLGSFNNWFLIVGVPGAALLFGYAIVARTRFRESERHHLMRSAVVAGLLGTVGYDLFRVPFMILGGYRLLSPIESYGVLLTDASASSGLTDFAGWTYHFNNGVGFAVVYAVLAARRHWVWGVVWAMILETGTLLTPFATDYNLVGKYDVIAIAYAAHVPYGLVLGLMLRDPVQTSNQLGSISKSVGTISVALTVITLALWLEPWVDHRPVELEPEDNVAVTEGRMEPEFIRVNEGDCFVIFNTDDATYQIVQASPTVELEPDMRNTVCLDGTGVVRLRVTGEPYDGGFVILDN